MSEKVNEDEVAMIELRRRNLRAAALLEQWIKEAEEEEDSTDWSVLEKEIQHSDLKFFEPEDP